MRSYSQEQGRRVEVLGLGLVELKDESNVCLDLVCSSLFSVHLLFALGSLAVPSTGVNGNGLHAASCGC